VHNAALTARNNCGGLISIASKAAAGQPSVCHEESIQAACHKNAIKFSTPSKEPWEETHAM
jgi:hypothetical protein